MAGNLDNSLPLDVRNVFNQLRNQCLLTDVTVECGEEKFSAHKVMLAANSPFFLAAFTQCKEDASPDRVEIPSDKNPADCLRLLQYIYSGNIDITKDTSNLLNAAEYFQLESISKACSAFLVKNVTPDNFLELWNNCEQNDKNTDFIVESIAANFSRYATRPDFLQLHSVKLRQILDCSKFISEGDSLLKAIVDWVDFGLIPKKPNRGKYFTEFVGHVDFSKVPSQSLAGIIENEPLFDKLPELSLFLSRQLIKSNWKMEKVFCIYDLQFAPFIEMSIVQCNMEAGSKLCKTINIMVELEEKLLGVGNDGTSLLFLTSGSTVIFDLATNKKISACNVPVLTAEKTTVVVCDEHVCAISNGLIYVSPKSCTTNRQWTGGAVIKREYYHVIPFKDTVNVFHANGIDAFDVTASTTEKLTYRESLKWTNIKNGKCFSAALDEKLYVLNNFRDSELRLYRFANSHLNDLPIEYLMGFPTQVVIGFDVVRESGNVILKIVDDCGYLWKTINKPGENWEKIAGAYLKEGMIMKSAVIF